MAEDPRADLVAKQYQKWRYPEPIQNLESWVADYWERYDPSHAHRLLWPDRPYRADLDILSAGCGTNQAPVIAYNNPAAKVTAIDISEESLDHGRYLKDKYGLRNLEFRLLPIEEVGSLDQSFDLIMCTGVLHHMASPEAGMKALAGVLRPDGVAAIMLYARYGRVGVEIMQSIFRDMALAQDDESLDLVKATLTALSPEHPVKSYISRSSDMGFDAGLVDTFLHGRDRSYTVDDCLDLVDSAGLVFQGWLLNSNYHPLSLFDPDSSAVAAVDRLPTPMMWSVMERINTGSGCHFFMATTPQRPAATYRIDFASPEAADYIPRFVYRAGLDGERIYRADWSVDLDSLSFAFARWIDGERSIGEIARQLAAGGVAGDGEDLASAGLRVFEGLWRADFIAIDLSAVNR